MARAPGRLDVMGGIADYSGSVVLEMPIAAAAYLAYQAREDGRFRFHSILPEADGPLRTLECETTETELGLKRLANGAGGWESQADALSAVGQRWRVRRSDRWAAYMVGCFAVLAAEFGERLPRSLTDGADCLLVSEVPLGAGVSSSAAVEVATMRALTVAAGLEMDGLTLARRCQVVENRVAGAPCGVMDQVTSALGLENQLLALKCQPHEPLGYQRIPSGYVVCGLDSGVKHSVGGTLYTQARVAAFMGHRILTFDSEEDYLNGYLCNLTPELLAATREGRTLLESLPETITGHDFLARYGATVDPVTTVNPSETYRVRACAEHPVREDARVKRFRACLLLAERYLEEDPAGEDLANQLMAEAGELMYESHRSYGENCHLGSEETDFLVEEVRRRGPDRGLFGAKITGGGSGGTVAVLMRDTPEAEAALDEVRNAYAAAYGFAPRRFVGSSPGAMGWEPIQGTL